MVLNFFNLTDIGALNPEEIMGDSRNLRLTDFRIYDGWGYSEEFKLLSC